MGTGSVTEKSYTLEVRIPAEMRFAAGTKDVDVRKADTDRALSPLETLASFNSHVIRLRRSTEAPDLSLRRQLYAVDTDDRPPA